MINKFSTTYIREDTINFIIDDDKNMTWLANFNSDDFDRFFVIIDEKVARLFGDLIWKRLKNHHKEVLTFKVEGTEHSKSLEFYPKLVSFLEHNRCGLNDLVLAIGGGTVIDLVSFTASTYMRGLTFISIPTTLIGQVDAATAGKTCLNTGNSKNLLGTFYYPIISYNNIHFLKTNTEYYQRQGYSEIFKYGLLKSEKLITLLDAYLNQPSDDILMKIIRLTIELRIKIRKKHPLASNLGHTFGHAIEKLSNFKILHGDAISAGIVVALCFAVKKGLIAEQEAQKIIKMMQDMRLNIYIEKSINIDKWVELMMSDKKSSIGSFNLVLITGVGKPYEADGKYFFKTTPATIKSFLIRFIKQYPYVVDSCASFLKKNKLIYKQDDSKHKSYEFHCE